MSAADDITSRLRRSTLGPLAPTSTDAGRTGCVRCGGWMNDCDCDLSEYEDVTDCPICPMLATDRDDALREADAARYELANMQQDRSVMSVNMVAMTKPDLSPEDKRALRKYAIAAQNATVARDRLICAFHNQGFSLRDIAEACGTITHSGVARIVKRG